MRIAFNGWFLRYPHTGTGQYSRRMLEGLQRSPGIRVLLVEPPARLPRRGILLNLLKVWFEQVGFPLACLRPGADVAFVPYFAPPLVGPVPVAVTVHDLIPLLFPEYAYSAWVRLYNRLVSAAVRKAALILTDSRASAADVKRVLGVNGSRIAVVYPGVDESLRRVRDRALLGGVRGRYRLPERFFLYLGGFDRRKNIPLLLDAYARLQRKLGEQAPALVMAGKIPARESPALLDPRPLLERMDLGKRVLLTGPVDEADKPAFYTLALAFVYPSLYEGFGLPPLEAMACGCPVLASDASSLPEVVGDAGLLLPPDDPEAWAEAMARVSLTPEFALDLARRGPSRAALFSWDRAVGAFLDALRGLALT